MASRSNSSYFPGSDMQQQPAAQAQGGQIRAAAFQNSQARAGSPRLAASPPMTSSPLNHARPNGHIQQPSQASQGSAASRSSKSRPPQLHDLDRVISLFKAKKFYCEGYLWRKSDLSSDGKQDPSGHWDRYFVQMTAFELSLWNAREMEAAAARGDSIGPEWLNMTDSFVSVVDPKVLGPNDRPPAEGFNRYVFALNNAGANRILFAAETEMELRKWVNCLRLAEWEAGRLNEIYTATLMGTHGNATARSPLVKGRYEGNVQVRIPGDTTFRSAWLVVTDTALAAKTKRRGSILSMSFSSSNNIHNMAVGPDEPIARASFYQNKKSKRPFFTFNNVISCASVYPDNENVIESSSIFRIEGLCEWDATGHADVPKGLDLQGRRISVQKSVQKGEPHASVIVLPEDVMHSPQNTMLTWVLAFADAFRLFGRSPNNQQILYDPRSAESPYHAYPIGQSRDRLFFHTALVEGLEPWDNKPSAIKAKFRSMLVERMSRPYTPPPEGNRQIASIPNGSSVNSVSPRPNESEQLVSRQQTTSPPVPYGRSAQDQQHTLDRRPSARVSQAPPMLPPIGQSRSIPPQQRAISPASRPIESYQQPAQPQQRMPGSLPSSENVLAVPMSAQTSSSSYSSVGTAGTNGTAGTSKRSDLPRLITDRAMYGQSNQSGQAPPPQEQSSFSASTATTGITTQSHSAEETAWEPQRENRSSLAYAQDEELASPARPVVSPEQIEHYRSPSLGLTGMSPPKFQNQSELGNAGISVPSTSRAPMTRAESGRDDSVSSAYSQPPSGDSLSSPVFHAPHLAQHFSRPEPINEQSFVTARMPSGPSSPEPEVASVLEPAVQQPVQQHSPPQVPQKQNEPEQTSRPPIRQMPTAINYSPMSPTGPSAPQSPAKDSHLGSSLRGSDLGHSEDMMAALSFIERTPSPSSVVSPEQRSTTPSALPSLPPSRTSNSTEQSRPVRSPSPDPYMPRQASTNSRSSHQNPSVSFPSISVSQDGPSLSTFEKSKEVERERDMAQQKQKQAQKEALHRPGKKSGSAGQQKKKMGDWSSEESEEEEQEEQERPQQKPVASEEPTSPISSTEEEPLGAKVAAHQRSMSGIPYNVPAGQGRSLPMPPHQMPTMTRPDRSPYRESPPDRARTLSSHSSDPHNRSNSSDRHNRSPSYSGQQGLYQMQPPFISAAELAPTGLLETGMHQRYERSAKAQEASARETGAPLVDLAGLNGPSTRAQGGLVGSIDDRHKARSQAAQSSFASGERDRETARQLDEERRRMSISPSQFGGMNPMMMNPYMMFNPYMMSGMQTMPGMQNMPGMQGQQNMPGMQGQQNGQGMDQQQMQQMQQMQFMQAQMAAQQAAQQAYMMQMSAFQQQYGGSSGGSQMGHGSQMPSYGGSPSFMPSHNPQQSMMGGSMLGMPSMMSPFNPFSQMGGPNSMMDQNPRSPGQDK